MDLISNIRFLWKFCWPYLKPVKHLLLAGVFLTFLYGATNVFLVAGVKIMVDRMGPPESVQPAKPAKPGWGALHLRDDRGLAGEWAAWRNGAKEKLLHYKVRLMDRLDVWLPRYGQELDWRRSLGCILFFPFLILIRGTLAYFSVYCLNYGRVHVQMEIKQEMLDKISSLSVDFFARTKTGDLKKRITGDTGRAYTFLSMCFNTLVKEPITIASILVVLLVLNWKLTLVALAGLPLSLAIMRVLLSRVRKASVKKDQALRMYSGYIVEIITNIRVIKAFSLENFIAKKFREQKAVMKSQGLKGARADALTNPVLELGASVGIGLVLYFAFSIQRTPSEMAALLTGLVLLLPPFKRLGAFVMLYQDTKINFERLKETLDELPTVLEPRNPVPKKTFDSEIRLEGVCFAYDTRPVLHDIDLVIPAGSKIGIAGESGSGKTTLLNLLLRFYDPTHGRIMLDGVDLRQIPSPDLRRLVSLVSQEVMLFDDTIEENIRMGNLEVDPAGVEAAARAANAHDFIIHTPHGYQTKVGERAVRLSGGQRQRVSIARAFIRNTPILVLDEATAALDAVAEEKVQAAIERLAVQKTTIAVAHRLSTLKDCDRIYMLDEGRVVESGNFQELLARGGLFSAMAAKQGMRAGS